MPLSTLATPASSNGMTEPLLELVTVVFDFAPFVKPTIAVVVKLGMLVVEIQESNQLCVDAVKHWEKIHSILQGMIFDVGIKIKHKQALEEYNTLIECFAKKLHEFSDFGPVKKFFKHFELRNVVTNFRSELERIDRMMGLESRWEEASNHQDLVKLIENQSEAMIHAFQESFAKHSSKAMIKKSDAATLIYLVDYILKPINHNCNATERERRAMKDAAKALIKASNYHGLSVSRWYTSRSNIVYEKNQWHAQTGSRTSYIGTYNFGSQAFIQAIDMQGVDDDTLKRLDSAISIWFELKDPHILPLYAGCNVNHPYLFVMELADRNFKQQFENSKRGFWRLFLDVARGLAYLHSESVRVVHGNLKCSNLLIVNNRGVISDFAFAYTKIKSSMTEKQQTPSINWKAPECFEQGASANPRHESDIYALGMCIFEAMTGELPYEGNLDDDILQKKRAGILPDRPDGVFEADAWDLIQHMCTHVYQSRWNLSYILQRIGELAQVEAANEGK